MIQKILLWAYIFGGFMVVWYAISAIQDYVRMVANRRPHFGWFRVALLGMIKPQWLELQGQYLRRQLIRHMVMFALALVMMWLIVRIGIYTQ